jgi:protease IV
VHPNCTSLRTFSTGSLWGGCRRWSTPIWQIVTSVLALATLASAGCGFQPLRLKAVGDLTANLSPAPKLEPVVPILLPHRLHLSEACGVAVVDIDGLLINSNSSGFGSWGENPVSIFRERLDAIEKDKRVKAVVLRINSPGGSVTASDIMLRDLLAFKARTGLPLVACLMDVGAGGAYYLATGADFVVAHPTTVTGAIGCILNLYNLQDLMAQFNIIGVPIKAGTNIDLGSPIKAIDEDHRKLLQAMADEYHARFRNIIVDRRPAVDGTRESTFDGRVFTAQQALALGLIDRIGYLDNAITAATKMANLEHAEVVFFHRRADPPLSPYAVTPNTPLQNTLLPVNVPGLDRSRLPTFLYLWQVEPTTEMLRGK